jgi:hypothetical protein
MNLSEKFLLAADKKLSNKGKNKNLLDTTSRLIEAGLETGGAFARTGDSHCGSDGRAFIDSFPAAENNELCILLPIVPAGWFHWFSAW